MSNYKMVYCIDCDSIHNGVRINHGEQTIRALIRHKSAIASMHEAMCEDSFLDLTCIGEGIDTGWFKEHHTHHLTVRSEYGQIDNQCENFANCPYCKSRRNCVLPQGHTDICDCNPERADRANA